MRVTFMKHDRAGAQE